MSTLFGITGGPRSGTAFMANLMSYGSDSWCFHECERDLVGVPPDDQVSIVMDRMELKPHWYVGNSSSGMIFWGQFNCPLVVIHRDWDEIEHSLNEAMVEWEQHIRITSEQIGQMKEALDRLCAINPDALHVNFKDLFDVDALEAIWRHCMPCILPQRDRFEELIRWKVTVKEWTYSDAGKGELLCLQQ